MVSERVPFSADDLADYAGMRLKEVSDGIKHFEKLGMLQMDQNLGAWAVPSWHDRQFESDDVTKRTMKHRSNERLRNVSTSAEGTPLDPGRNGPETETETETEKRNAQRTRPADDRFGQVWEIYPRKVEKQRALRAFVARLRAGASFDDLQAATTHYAESVAGQDPKYIKHAATFFGPDEPFRDYVDPPKAPGISYDAPKPVLR